MTLADALALREGDTVCHSAGLDYRADGTPVMAPIRVTKVWVNAKSSIVLIRANAIGGAQWLDATGYELPPPGLVYDRTTFAWMTPEEKKLAVAERRVAG
jgi:hypothetical protein